MSDARAAAAPRPLTWAEKHLLGVRAGEVLRLLPGLALVAAIAAASLMLARYAGDAVLRAQGIAPATSKGSPVSPVTAAILVGLVVGNVVALPKSMSPGLDFAAKKLLRLGIILLGVKLSVTEAFSLGASAVPAVLGVVLAGLFVVPWAARRLGVGDRLGVLAAASTSICGVSAALATAPVIDAEERETACTVANVTLFGLLAMFLHPWIAHLLFADAPGSAGVFLGVAVHDTSQVAGAATIYGSLFDAPGTVRVAVVTKLLRNFCLVAVVPYLAWRHAKRNGAAGKKTRVLQLVPLFVFGFLAAAALRSWGEADLAAGRNALGLFEAANWKAVVRMLGDAWSTALLAAAMAAAGAQTRFAGLKSLGPRPFLVGGLAAAFVAAVGLALAAAFGPRVA
ncbi:MAG TPA: putative sulfate exporter family transporter [Planctomycetota bacterium]|nr:putative sulfate exporter family transporter [Planctomycetota bacterium]